MNTAISLTKSGSTLALSQQVVQAIASVVGPSPAVLHEPRFQGNEWRYVKECLDSTFVSSVGKFVDRFEADLARYTGARHAIAVVNGTAALHVALQLAGVRSGDEVLVPALTFVATANAVTYCGATPHFVDSEKTTLGMAAGPLGVVTDTRVAAHTYRECQRDQLLGFLVEHAVFSGCLRHGGEATHRLGNVGAQLCDLGGGFLGEGEVACSHGFMHKMASKAYGISASSYEVDSFLSRVSAPRRLR